jgi:RNA polymerase sigma-70 factor (ECF subfamily)
LELIGRKTDVLRRARHGDLEAFESILRENERLVYRVALRLLGNREDARDAAQEVFLRLHRSLGRIDESRDLAPWLYRVTVNVATDLLRSRKREVPIDYAPPVSEVPDYTAGDRRRALEEVLARLPEKERAAIVLRDIEGLSTSEVAEVLGSSEATVRSQISIARSKLRRWLTGGRRP